MGCDEKEQLKEWEQYGTQPFNEEQWKQYNNRLAMLWDLVRTAHICNLTATELKDVLGRDDGYYLHDTFLAWRLAQESQFVIDIPPGKKTPEEFFITNPAGIETTYVCE